MPTIDALIAGHAHKAEVHHQPITWRRASWERLWEEDPGLPGRDVLDSIDGEVAGQGAGTIRRSWIRSLGDGDPAVFLAASTIWGYGKDVRLGPPALQAMLTTPDVEAVVRDIVEAARRDASDGFIALFDDRGGTRIKSLGIAFGTKVVHFAGYDHAHPRPLILDSRVYAAARALDDPGPVPDPARYTTGEQYRNYCAWAEQVASRNGVHPELVEYVLFMDGGHRR